MGFLICAWRWRQRTASAKRVDLRPTAAFDYLGQARCLILRSFIANHWIAAGGVTPLTKKRSPPENYGKEDHTTVAAFLPWRDL